MPCDEPVISAVRPVRSKSCLMAPPPGHHALGLRLEGRRRCYTIRLPVQAAPGDDLARPTRCQRRLHAVLSFAAAVFLLIITPGPGVLSTAGVGSAYGFARGLRYVAGLFIGTNLVSAAVISGLAALVLGVPYVREALLFASVG